MDESLKPVIGQFYFRLMAILDDLTARYCAWRARSYAKIRMEAYLAQKFYEGRIDRHTIVGVTKKGRLILGNSRVSLRRAALARPPERRDGVSPVRLVAQTGTDADEG